MLLSEPESLARIAARFRRAAARLRRSKANPKELSQLVRDTFPDLLMIAKGTRRADQVEWTRDQLQRLIADEVELMKRDSRLTESADTSARLMASELDAATKTALGPHHLQFDGDVETNAGRLIKRIKGGPRVRMVPGNFHVVTPSGLEVELRDIESVAEREVELRDIESVAEREVELRDIASVAKREKVSKPVGRGRVCVQIKEEMKRFRYSTIDGGKSIKEIQNETPDFLLWKVAESDQLPKEDRETLLHPNQWGRGYATLLLSKYFGVSKFGIRDSITAYNVSIHGKTQRTKTTRNH